MKRRLLSMMLCICLLGTASGQTSARDWYAKGLKLNDSSKNTEAVKAFGKAIQLDVNYFDAYYRLGWTYNELHDYNMAIVRLLKAIQLKKNDAFSLQELGYAYNGKQNYTEALNYLNQAIAVKPDYTRAYKQLGDVYLKLKRDAEGIAAYEKAYALDNTQETVCYELGYWHNARGNYDKALEWLNKAIAIKPAVDSYNELGFAYYSLKKNDEAIAAYKNALRVNPLNGTAYKGIGDVYRRNYSPAKTTEALASYRMAVQNNPSSAGSYFGMGWCYNEQNNYDSAITNLNRALALDDTIVAAYTELGYAQYMKKYYSDALATFNKGLSLNPKLKLPIYYKGLVYIALKDKTSAGNIYNQLLPIDAELAAKLSAKINVMTQ